MTERRKLTTLDKLKILARQSVCPRCGEKLKALNDIDYDHIHPLALGGEDTLENRQGLHRACHREKTHGRKGTTAGSDIHRIAKTKRLEKARTEPKRKKPSRWASRPMPGGRDSDVKFKMNGTREKR